LPSLIEKTAAAVKKAMLGEGTGHDWWHVRRVWKTAARLAREERGADAQVAALGALLHDLGDWKFHGGDEEAAPREAGKMLKRLGAAPGLIAKVQAICREVSFKGAGVRDRPSSLEARIVQDADRLDALGAIGIARCFAYGGAKGRQIYEPGVKPVMHQSFAAYKKAKGHSVNHFYEKLLLLKGRMHTASGKRLARERDAFLRAYLRRFLAEWEGRQ
jgi:uncharacterized protein